jgi:hypothetical protein
VVVLPGVTCGEVSVVALVPVAVVVVVGVEEVEVSVLLDEGCDPPVVLVELVLEPVVVPVEPPEEPPVTLVRSGFRSVILHLI